MKLAALKEWQWLLSYVLGIIVCHFLFPATITSETSPTESKIVQCPPQPKITKMKPEERISDSGSDDGKMEERKTEPSGSSFKSLFRNLKVGNSAVRTWEKCTCKEDFEVPVKMLTQSEVAARLERINSEAVSCPDTGKGVPEVLNLARCAMNYIINNTETLFDKDRNQIIFDYGYDGSDYSLSDVLPPKFVFLTSFLDSPATDLPEKRILKENQVSLSPPTPYRLRSLFVTNSIFDVNLVLRMDELLENVKGELNFMQLLGRLLGMARVTYLLLPCKESWYPEDALRMDSSQLLLKAVRHVMKESKGKLGVIHMDFEVDILKVFKSGTCVRELIKVSAVKIQRGVRLKWCYYPLGTKYDLIYRRGEMIQLVHRYVQQYTRAGGDKVKSIRKWKPSINMADILGWGTTDEQREVLFWDFLTQPSCPDPAIQNWLLTEGARVLRIDPNQQAIKGQHPAARDYVQFIRIFLCVSLGKEWKQVFSYQNEGVEIGLHHVTLDGQYRFAETVFSERKNGIFNPVIYGKPIHKECPDCEACELHTWRPLKLVWHNNVSLPPPACHRCYECQKKRLLGKGVKLRVEYNGCNDVEGVSANNVSNPDLCYDTQLKALPRMSATPAALEKGPY